jgi:GNAT superfamily N-acetyltransferase
MPIMRSPLAEEHVPFVCGSFIKSWRHAHMRVPEEIYYSYAKKHIGKLVYAATGVALVDEDNPFTIVGWALYTDDVLHYAYVRKDFRNQGLYKQLLEGIETNACSHCTPVFQPHRARLVYVPYYFT